MSHHPYTKSLTKPLANHPTCKAKAEAMLAEAFDPATPDVECLTSELATAPTRKPRRILPWAAACIALVLALISSTDKIRVFYHISNLDIFQPALGMPAPKIAGLTEHEQLLLGEPGIDPLEQKRRLHQHDPDNPAYFFEYASAWVMQHEELPPDFLKTAQRIDPDNSAFLYFAAAIIGRESFEKIHRSSSGEPRMIDGVQLPRVAEESEFDIIDEAKFLEATALISQAARLPEFRTYWSDMARSRIRLYPADTLMAMFQGMIHTLAQTSQTIHIRHVADILSARAEMLSKNGDADAFLALAAERDALITGFATHEDVNLVNELVYQVMIFATSLNFHAAAERLELDELADAYRRQRDGFQAAKDARDIRSHHRENSFETQRFSILATQFIPMIARQVESPPPISEAELKPMRLAEHEVAGAIVTQITAIFVLLAGLALFLSRFIFPRFIRLPAARIATAPGIRDALWVILLGVCVPLVCFLLITRLTPLGGRGFNLQDYFILPLAQYAALLLALLLTPLLVARWRVSRWLSPLGLPKRASLFSFITLDSLCIWIFATYPLVRHFELSGIVLAILHVPLIFFLALLVATLIRIIKGAPVRRLAYAATVIAALPAYPLAAVALLAILPLHHASEKHWIERETLIRIDPDAPDLGAYEFQVAAQKRKETNAILGLE